MRFLYLHIVETGKKGEKEAVFVEFYDGN